MTTPIVTQSTGQRSLPTFRCNIDKQIEILKAVVVFFDKNRISASYREIAPLADVDPTVVSGTLGFWKDIGILEGDSGKYRPSNALIEMIRQLTWGDKDGAWRLFRQAIAGTWFMSHLTMSFQIRKQMTLEELTNSLGSAAGSPDRDKNTATSIRNLVALVEISGILTKDSSGNFNLNPALAAPKQQALNVDEQKSNVLVRIGSELYAVDSDQLKEFVKHKGKTADPTQQQLV